MSEIPDDHIRDSHELVSDGRVDLFDLTPSGGTGVVRFKDGNDQLWLGNLYTGVPLQLSGEKRSSDSGLAMPKLQIGQNNVDLSMFKALVYDGYLDNAVIIRSTLLLDNLLNNRNIREVSTYRVKRVEQYSRTQISLQLATLSDSLGFQLPYRTYLPPAFPSVQLL
jgi:phage-related protein